MKLKWKIRVQKQNIIYQFLKSQIIQGVIYKKNESNCALL